MTTTPPWFAVRYPTVADLEAYAWGLGAVVMRGPCGAAGIVYVAPPGTTTICIPEGLSHLEEVWQLAHEVAHLALHEGYTSHDRQEAAADRWAACALIPEARVSHYGNASLDAFIGALSAHYGDIPLKNCPERRLAARIASIRMKWMEAG